MKKYKTILAYLLIINLFISLSLPYIDVQAAAKPVKSITLTTKSKDMTVGDTFTLKVKTVSPKSASKAVTWKSLYYRDKMLADLIDIWCEKVKEFKKSGFIE